MYYPILGLINLFIHVLRSPHVSTVTSDIALLDVVAGHLARLEFASGGKITFSFAREVSRISREAIRNAEMQRKVQKTQANPPLSSDIPTPSPFLIQDPLGTVVSQNQDIIANEMLEWDDNNVGFDRLLVSLR